MQPKEIVSTRGFYELFHGNVKAGIDCSKSNLDKVDRETKRTKNDELIATAVIQYDEALRQIPEYNKEVKLWNTELEIAGRTFITAIQKIQGCKQVQAIEVDKGFYLWERNGLIYAAEELKEAIPNLQVLTLEELQQAMCNNQNIRRDYSRPTNR